VQSLDHRASVYKISKSAGLHYRADWNNFECAGKGAICLQVTSIVATGVKP